MTSSSGLRRAGVAVGPWLTIVAASSAWALAVGVDHRYISFSDGAYTYIASVVAVRGAHALYDPIVFSQPPLTMLGAALVWRVSPHIESVRACLAALAGLRSLLTYSVARRVGLNRAASVVAALLALTAPVHAQFSGLDGEALLGPLALAVAWSALERRWWTTGVLAGLGLLVKLTWAPALLVLAVVLARRGGRELWRVTFAALLSFVGVAAILIETFGWKLGDLVHEVVVGQLHSGSQPLTLGRIVLVLLLLWWPLLVLAKPALRSLPGAAPLLAVGVLLLLETVKEGTFYNVLDPLEPFLAIGAVAGALELWRRHGKGARRVLAVCALGLAAHIATTANSRIANVVPVPFGAAFVHTDNQLRVDVIARAIDAHSRPGQEVLVNPFFALVAKRREVAGQADWFILHALATTCGAQSDSPFYCHLWGTMKATAKSGRVPVVSVDSNVTSFDSGFRAETGVARMHEVLTTSRLPITDSLYVRSP